MSSGFVSYSCHFFRTSQTCTCGGYTSCSCRRAHACSSGTVFVTVTVDRGRCADQLDRRRGYARPAVGSRPRSRENMVAVNADALVGLTRAVLPALSLHRCGTDCPSAVRPPRQQLRIALRGHIRHSDVLPLSQGPAHSIRLGCNGFTPSFVDDLYCPR